MLLRQKDAQFDHPSSRNGVARLDHSYLTTRRRVAAVLTAGLVAVGISVSTRPASATLLASVQAQIHSSLGRNHTIHSMAAWKAERARALRYRTSGTTDAVELANSLVTPNSIAPSIVHDFVPNGAGASPQSSLISDGTGNFLGTTANGGTNGTGTVFSITPSGTVTILHSFGAANTSDADGAHPASGLVLGSDQNYYGVTTSGGANNDGTIFQLTPAHAFIIVYSFTQSPPSGNLVLGPNGLLYGVTPSGGTTDEGTVFSFSPSAGYTTVYDFTGNTDGGAPVGSLLFANGQLFGTTSEGGNAGSSGAGTLFRLSGQSVHVLYTFSSGSDGGSPQSGLVADSTGNIYGVTSTGGDVTSGAGYGIVFKYTSTGLFNVLHAFKGNGDGAAPVSTLCLVSGILYGTTSRGGDIAGDPGGVGAGTIFSITTSGRFTTLHELLPADGYGPNALVLGLNGDLYGTSASGGANGVGTFFQVTTGGTYTNEYSWTGGFTNGSAPTSLISGLGGDLFGTTQSGGPDNAGVVFELTPAGVLSILHSFTGGNDGSQPSPLIFGTDGNFYGTTAGGGANGFGTIFQLTSAGTLNTIYSFTGGSDGAVPMAPVIEGADGNLYGTTSQGGNEQTNPNGYGTVFQVPMSSTPAALNTLHEFADGVDGATPTAALVQASDGNLYGTANQYGETSLDQPQSGSGVIFKISTLGAFVPLYTFTGGADGGAPAAALVQNPADGYLYGTATVGGDVAGDPSGYGYGVVFKVSTSGSFSTIYAFTNAADGSTPDTTLAFTSNDTEVIGGTQTGGNTSADTSGIGFGSIFVMSTTGDVENLYDFSGGADGAQPSGFLVDGNIVYGTTLSGGKAGGGTAFDIVNGPTVASVSVVPNRGIGGVVEPSGTVTLSSAAPVGGWLVDLASSDNAAASVPAEVTIPPGSTTAPFTLTTRAVTSTAAVSITASTASSSKSTPLTVDPAPTHYLVTVSPAQTTIGSTVNVTVSAVDAAGATITEYSNTVTVTSSDPNATIPPKTPLPSTVLITNGTASFSLTFDTVGLQTVTVTDTNKLSGTSKPVPVQSIVTFVKSDTTNQGNWKGAYGGDGWNVFGDTSGNNPRYPNYSTVSAGSASSAVWASSSLAADALQSSAVGSVNRVAGVWYGKSWTMTLGSAGLHQIALYLVDFKNVGYNETITVKDAVTGATLDTRQASSFAGGEYFVWNINGKVTITFTSNNSQVAVLNGIFFGGGTNEFAPSAPSNVTAVAGKQQVVLSWKASAGASSYYIYRGVGAGQESTSAIASAVTATTYTDTGASGGTYYYKIAAVNGVGGSFASAEALAVVPSSAAQFVDIDTTTGGNWKGVYGLGGWSIVGDPSGNNPTLPTYATLVPTGNSQVVWSTTSTSPRCLQESAHASTARIAAAWYQTHWSMNVNMHGSHRLALYLLDYNDKGYAETITIKDAATGIVLDSRSASQFSNGKYYVWDISGDVTITFTSTAATYAVLSGVFFG